MVLQAVRRQSSRQHGWRRHAAHQRIHEEQERRHVNGLPNAVKEALYASNVVSEVEMQLERDEFIVKYDSNQTGEDELIAIVRKSSHAAAIRSVRRAGISGSVFVRNPTGDRQSL
jgi:copper chaperone CopZ